MPQPSDLDDRLRQMERENASLRDANQALHHNLGRVTADLEGLRASGARLGGNFPVPDTGVLPTDFTHEPYSFDNIPPGLSTHGAFKRYLREMELWEKIARYANYGGWLLGSAALLCITARDWPVFSQGWKNSISSWGVVFSSSAFLWTKAVQCLESYGVGFRAKAQEYFDRANHHATPPRSYVAGAAGP